MNKLNLGFSSCPNDTYIFDALVNGRVDSNCEIFPHIQDVEALNKMALKGDLEVSKISFATYPFISHSYQILSAGSALGYGCGPLLISREMVDLSALNQLSVAIPGVNTTAHMLLSFFFPEIKHKKEMLFSAIEDAVSKGDAQLGLIIHENRFTYDKRGLLKVADLGEMWTQRFGLPIPLGCIVVKRSLPEETKKRIQEMIRQSITWAFEHPEDSMDYVAEHAVEMSSEVRKMHIDLYVNQFSIDLGKEGADAIRTMFKIGQEAGVFPSVTEPVFINDLS